MRTNKIKDEQDITIVYVLIEIAEDGLPLCSVYSTYEHALRRMILRKARLPKSQYYINVEELRHENKETD